MSSTPSSISEDNPSVSTPQADVAIVNGRGRSTAKQAAEATIAVPQRQEEQGGLVADASDDHFITDEVTLSLTRRMQQRHEDLGL
jgi:hypothetical protein